MDLLSRIAALHANRVYSRVSTIAELLQRKESSCSIADALSLATKLDDAITERSCILYRGERPINVLFTAISLDELDDIGISLEVVINLMCDLLTPEFSVSVSRTEEGYVNLVLVDGRHENFKIVS